MIRLDNIIYCCSSKIYSYDGLIAVNITMFINANKISNVIESTFAFMSEAPASVQFRITYKANMNFLLGIILASYLSYSVLAQGHDHGVLTYRLPNHTHPETYEISVATRIDSAIFTYDGYVKIGIIVDLPTSEIVLHMQSLDVLSVSLDRIVAGSSIKVNTLSYSHDKLTDFLRIKTNQSNFSAADRLNLHIVYNGTLSTEARGFYASEYTNSAGETEYCKFRIRNLDLLFG